MSKFRFLLDADFIVIGRRHGSDDVALEGAETEARWRRDVAPLAAYGFGQAGLDGFVAMLAEHGKLRAARPDAVAGKKMSVVNRDQQVAAGWAWVDRVSAVLGTLGRTDRTLATALATATPDDDAGLEAGIRALATLLTENQGRLPADAQVAQRLAEVATLSAGLLASPGAVHTSKSQTVADTQQIDLLDGKLCVMVRDLNAAARAAIRNGDLRASASDYMFHHLRHASGTPAAPAPASQPAKPQPQPAVS